MMTNTRHRVIHRLECLMCPDDDKHWSCLVPGTLHVWRWQKLFSASHRQCQAGVHQEQGDEGRCNHDIPDTPDKPGTPDLSGIPD